MTTKFGKPRNIQIWEIGTTSLIWLAILLPWIKEDSSGGTNALVIALMGGFGLFELTSNPSAEEMIITIFAFIFFIGIFCISLYAFNGLRYGFTEKRFLNRRLRKAFVIIGFLPAIIIAGYSYFSFSGNGASHFTGIAIGYWAYWIGITTNAFVEFRNFRLLRPYQTRNDIRN